MSFYHPHKRVSIFFNDDDPSSISLTKQSHKAECDINNILKQFSKTGIINHINTQQPQYLNLPDSIDYQVSLNVVAQASEAFDTLPSLVRDYYRNDPLVFLAALEDPNERQRLEEYGVLKPRPAPVKSSAGADGEAAAAAATK